jgi:glycosyltransferase 2 family protein
VTLSLLFWLGYQLEWAELGRRLVQVDLGWLALAVVVAGIGYFLMGLRWWLLLRVQRIEARPADAVAATLVGQFFNAFLLGSTGGDLARMVYAARWAPKRKTEATLSLVMDRSVGLLTLLGLAAAALPWSWAALMRDDETRLLTDWMLVALFAAAALGIGFGLLPFHRAPEPLRQLWKRVPGRVIIERLVAGFRQHGKSRRLTGAAFAVALSVHLLEISASYFVARSLGLGITYAETIVIVALVYCAIALPVSIGGHGVREGAFALLFTAFAVTGPDGLLAGRETAIAYSLLFYGMAFVWSGFGGLVYLRWGGGPKPEPAAGRSAAVSKEA